MPNGYTEEVKEFLDYLRESGVCNMFGAGPYLQKEFGFDRSTANDCLKYWMTTFDKE